MPRNIDEFEEETSMRKLTTIILSFSALGILPAASFAEDQVQVAEKLLEAAFSCPTSIGKLEDGNGPNLQILNRSYFHGERTKFRVTEDDRQLETNRGGNRPPLETLRRFITIAKYADLEHVKIDGKNLVLSCKAGQKCIDFQMNVIKETDDTGNVSSTMFDSKAFGFCDDETLYDAKSASDALIAPSPSSR